MPGILLPEMAATSNPAKREPSSDLSLYLIVSALHGTNKHSLTDQCSLQMM